MYSSTVELTLPDTFFSALDKVVETVKEGFNGNEENNRTELYHNNLLNYTENQTFIPKFEERHRFDYIKIGKVLMEGMSEIFFEKLERYNDKKDYYNLKEKSSIAQIAPIVNVNIEKDLQQKEENSGQSLLSSIPLALLFAGVAAGTSVYGQLIESVTLLPKLIKNSGGFFKIVKNAFSKIPAVLKELDKLGQTVGKSFSKLITITDKIKGFGNSVVKTISKVGGSIGNIGSILAGKVGQFGAKIASKLKFLPIIGSALGFYQTYLRLSRGEIFLGILEFAAAISTLLPGPGTAIAIGINAIQAILETGSTGIGGVASLVIKKVAGAGAKLLPKLTGSIAKFISKPLAVVLKKIPFIGPIISFGMAVSDFSGGSTLSGVFNILAGLAGLIDFVAPGIGTAIAIAIDALNFFFTSTETGQGVASSIGNFFKGAASVIGDFFNGIYNWLISGAKAVVEKISVIWSTVSGFVTNIISSIVTVFTSKINFISNVFTSIFEFGKNIFSKLTSFFDDFDLFDTDSIISSFNNVINSISNFFTDTFSSIGSQIKNIFDKFDLSSLFDFSKLFSYIKNIGSNIVTNISNWGKSIVTFITDIFDNITEFFTNINFSSIFENFPLFNFIKDFNISIFNKISAGIDIIHNFFDNIINKFKDVISNIDFSGLTNISESISELFDFSSFGDLFDSVLVTVKDSIITAWNEIKNFFKNAWSGIKEKVSELISTFTDKVKSFGKNIFGFFTDTNVEEPAITQKQPDIRITKKPEEPAKIDTNLVNNQLTNDQNIKAIATNIKRTDSATSININKLCNITESILSELIKKPGGLTTITTNNIVNGGVSTTKRISKASDPRTAYAS